MSLPLYDLTDAEGPRQFDQRLAMLRATVDRSGETAQTVARIIADVARLGDAAVIELMQRFTDPDYQADRIRVPPQALAEAADRLDPSVKNALQAAIDNVRTYQRHILPSPPEPIHLAGATIRTRYTPVDSAALAVPGGVAPLLSTVVMLGVPALVAGVDPERLILLTPPPTLDRDSTNADAASTQPDIHPAVLAACHLVGIRHVFRVGGAQGIAAAALGTDTIPAVDLIVGPGSVYTQLAKAQLAGTVGIDGFYGPSEIVSIVDASARYDRIAADLIAQAEHDPGKCFLIAWDRGVIDGVLAEVARQLPERNRREAIERALADESCALLVRDGEHAAEAANRIAPEHMNLSVSEPEAMLERIRHVGEIFVGDASPVAAGDYYAGPSHTLPTGTTARFTSGVSVHTFLKRTGVIDYADGLPQPAIDAIAALAEAEGLDGHAASVRIRGQTTSENF